MGGEKKTVIYFLFFWWYISFFYLVIYFLRSRLVGRSLGGAWPFRQPQHTIGHFLCSVRLRKWSDLSSPIVPGRRMTCLQVPECPSAHPQKMKLDLIWCSILFCLVLCDVKNARLQHCNKKDSFGKYHEMYQHFDKEYLGSFGKRHVSLYIEILFMQNTTKNHKSTNFMIGRVYILPSFKIVLNVWRFRC